MSNRTSSQIDEAIERVVRPLINDLNATVETLKDEVAGNTVAENETERAFESILRLFLCQAFEFNFDTVNQTWHIVKFVGTQDEGFNELFFEAIRSGKWSSMLAHPLLSHTWGTPLFNYFTTALSSVGVEAGEDLARKFERYRLGSNPSASKTTRPAPLWLMVSFIRHAESQANTGRHSIIDPKLTQCGREQAARLGAQWSTTRINKLYLSPTARTRETTEGILTGRADEVETEERELLIEQDFGPEYTALLVAGHDEAASYLRTNGASPGSRPVDVRRAHRTPGGESQEDLARRAQLALLQIVFEHGVYLSSPPSPESWDGSLVEGIPHIVLVTHNLFLSELFESLQCWEQPWHTETSIQYRNTNWSRHLLRLDWPDDDFSFKSYCGSLFGLRLGDWHKMCSSDMLS